mgnify:CR=1 FL=1
MFAKITSTNGTLHVKDDFASLVNITRDDFVFEFFYDIDQEKAVKQNSYIVEITVQPKTVKQNPFPDKKLPPEEIIKGLLVAGAKLKHSEKLENSFVLTHKNVDLSSKINNSAIGDLKQGKAKESQKFVKRKIAIRTKAEISLAGNEAPSLAVKHVPDNYSAVKALGKRGVQHRAQKSLIKIGVDPSEITNIVGSSFNAAVKGTSKDFVKQNHHLNIVASKLLGVSGSNAVASTDDNKGSRITDQADLTLGNSDELVFIVEHVTDAINKHNTIVRISRSELKKSNTQQVIVKFVLLNSKTGLPVETVEMLLDVSYHEKVFRVPKIAPIVKWAKMGDGQRVKLQVSSLDHVTRFFRVYRKLNLGSYDFVGEYQLETDKIHTNVIVPLLPGKLTIYRVIPSSISGVVSSEFTNVVVPQRMHQRQTVVSVVTKIVSTGISIEVRNLPLDVVSFRVLHRDLTLHESAFSIVSNDVILSSDSLIAYVVVDSNVKVDHVYEYACVLVYEDGIEVKSGYSILEYVPFSENIVDSVISDVSVSETSDVSFDVVSSVTESEVDTIKKLLEKQNALQFFTDDIFNEREKLQSLIAHRIARVNLTTGDREDFGILSTKTFSDSSVNRTKNNVSELSKGQSYRYEITSLLRSPETMMISEKKVVDPLTKNAYVFKPNKFLHPNVKKGSIADVGVLALKYGKHAFSFGNIGAVTYLDVSLNKDSARIDEVSAQRFDRKTVTVTWQLKGDQSTIDHFLVLKIVGNARYMQGKVHSNFDTNQCQYIHALTDNDVGEMRYVVIPVLSDYSFAQEAQSNSVVVV